MKALKKTLFWLLTQPIIGRPLRKLVWINLKIAARFHHFFGVIFTRLPYVQKLLRENYDITPLLKYYKFLSEQNSLLPYQPKVSVIVPVYEVKETYLKEALQSVVKQTYENWELCIVDDCSPSSHVSRVIEEFKARYPDKIKFSRNQKNSHISITSNNCLALATGEYITLLDHDDRLYPNALGELVRYINFHDHPDILYSDERIITHDGSPLNVPFFKPDFSPQFHLAVNYTTHMTAYRTDLVRKIGGFRAGFEGSQDHDLMLRMVEASNKKVVHIPLCLYQWRSHELSMAGNTSSKPYAAIAGEKAVAEALERRGRPAKVTWDAETCHYRVHYQLPDPHPLVSIIIPSRDGFEQVSTCLNSIFGLSRYQNFEVILMDNGTECPQCLEFFSDLVAREPNRFRVIDEKGTFNFARLNNKGVDAARGDYVLLLNNDTEVLTEDWIEQLLMYAQLPEIGAVGCKLLYPNGRLQHAGIVLTARSIASHTGVTRTEDDSFYNWYSKTPHEVSGVTAACLMIAKIKYKEVGGLDEVWMPNGFGDVDFCLSLVKAGYTNLYTPYARLYHYESVTRKATLEYFEHFYLRKKYPDLLLNDPYLPLTFNHDSTYAPDIHYLGFDLCEEDFRKLLWEHK